MNNTRPILHKPTYKSHILIEPISDEGLKDRFFYFAPNPDARPGGSGVEQGGKPAISPNERARLANTMSSWLKANPDSRRVIEELAGVKFRKMSKEWPKVTKRVTGRITEEAQDYFRNNREDVLSRIKGPLSKSRFAQRRQLAAAIRESQQNAIITKRKEIEEAQKTGDVALTTQARTSEAIIDKGGRSLNRGERAATRQQALRDVLTGNSEFANQRKAEEAAKENARKAELAKIQQENPSGFQDRVQSGLNEIMKRTGKNITLETATPAERQMLQQTIIDQYHAEQQQADTALREETQRQITVAGSEENAKFNSLMLVDGMSAEDAINQIVSDKKDAKVKAEATKRDEATAKRNERTAEVNRLKAKFGDAFLDQFNIELGKVDATTEEGRNAALDATINQFKAQENKEINDLKTTKEYQAAFKRAYADLVAQATIDGKDINQKAFEAKAEQIAITKIQEAAAAAEAAKTEPTAEDVLKGTFVDTETDAGRELLAQLTGLNPDTQQSALDTIKDAQSKTAGLNNPDGKKKALIEFFNEAIDQATKGGGSGPIDYSAIKGFFSSLIELMKIEPTSTEDAEPTTPPASEPTPEPTT